MRCLACNKLMSNHELCIDYDFCSKCLSISNEARLELENEDVIKKQKLKDNKCKNPKKKD